MSTTHENASPPAPAHEPNHFSGRPLSVEYMSELVAFLLAQMRFGNWPGLLPQSSKRRHALPELRSADMLQLASIVAIGENGYPIVVPPDQAEVRIRPLDLRPLPAGSHRICACLTGERVPFGEAILSRGGNGGAPVRHMRWCAPRVVLAPESERAQFVDWLPVAIVHRVERGGFLSSVLDRNFHPPVADMTAYTHANPLLLLAERGLQALEGVRDAALHAALRTELTLLGNLAERGRPDTVLLQAQRCLALMGAARIQELALPRDLEQVAYDPNTFCEFLGRLAAALSNGEHLEPFPVTIEIAGKPCLRLDPRLLPDGGGFFKWKAPRADFVAGGLFLYFPRVVRGELPQMSFGRSKQDLDQFSPAREAPNVSGPGVAMQLEGLRGPVDSFLLKAIAGAELNRLEQRLSEGHALYYHG